uniref:Uncharacterized protein n=1 Tax=Tanacetum cinerariifolium TaxID=118510 RepID=A0A699GWU3_TANCI|nr:hypothetical protein [Tanacetum cinerariifolium]
MSYLTDYKEIDRGYVAFEEQFWTTAKGKNINEEAQIYTKVDAKKVIISKASIRRDLRFGDEGGIDCFSNKVFFEQLTLMGVPTEHVADKAVNEEMDDNLERATTTATSLDAEFENVSKFSNDPLLAGVNTPRSREDSLKLTELIELCTNLQQRVFDLETTKTFQAQEITSLKKRVKRLEKKRRSRTHGLKRLYKVRLNARVESSADEESLGEEDASKQGRISDIDANQDIYLVNVHRDEDIFDVNDQDDTLVFDADRIYKEQEEEANSALIETWEDIQAKVDADYQLAERLQAEEQEQLTDAEKAKLFMDFIEKRKKFFAAKRDEEKRNKPPTKAQQRILMCTYLNIDGWKPRALKNKSFAKIKELFDKAMTRINKFVDFRTELVEESTKKDKAETIQESSSKRAGDELD